MGYYGWSLGAAAATSWLGAWWMAGRLGLDRRKAAVCYLAAAVAVVLGARGLFWVTQPPALGESSLAAFCAPHPTGFALFGGLVAGMIAGALAARAAAVDPWTLADAAVVPLGLGIAVARVGCFAAGCCHGLPTDVPWGMAPSVASPAYLAQVANNPACVLAGVRPIHPTQLYELAAALLAAAAAAALLVVRRISIDGLGATGCLSASAGNTGRQAARGTRHFKCVGFLARRVARGVPALVGVLLFTALRWCVLPLRDLGPTAEVDLRLYPALYATLAGLLGAMLWWRMGAWKRPSSQNT